MRKIFGSLRLPKITSFHAAEIELPPKARVCSQANFKQKKLYWYLGFSSYIVFSFVFGMLCNYLINYQGSPNQAVTGKIYRLQHHSLPPKTAVVIKNN